MREVHLPSLSTLPEGAALLRPAALEHAPTLVDDDCRVFVGDELVACFKRAELDGGLVAALQEVRYDRGGRASGLPHFSRTVGYLPRVVIRRDFCRISGIAQEHPEAQAALERLCSEGVRFFQEMNPAQFEAQRDLLAKEVKPCWVMPGGTFTSGIVNSTSQLFYHRDQGNFPRSWSVMYVVTSDVSGGALVVPEWGLAFDFSKPSWISFEGARFLHGVSPIKRRGIGSYRYSVVFYAMVGMKNCLDRDGELRRIQVLKTQRERKRAGL